MTMKVCFCGAAGGMAEGCDRLIRNRLTARARGADLADTLVVGTAMAGGISLFAWLITHLAM